VLADSQEWQSTEFGLQCNKLAGANEAYLLHGTGHAAVDKIISEGFDCRVGDTGYFGFGAYFAENASKSDEYTEANEYNERVMFLARVCLGVPFEHHDDARKNLQQSVHLHKKKELREIRRAPFLVEFDRPADSLVHIARRLSNNPKSWPWKNSEFIIYSPSQAYPEFLITYKRIEQNKPK
jgi:hypothetical protein